MDFISDFAQGFMALFQAGGETFVGWVTGIIPMVICLMTAINSIIKLIGEKRVENFTKKLTRFTIARYTLVPVLAVLFLGNPMCYTFGRFVEEKYKPAYYKRERECGGIGYVQKGKNHKRKQRLGRTTGAGTK